MRAALRRTASPETALVGAGAALGAAVVGNFQVGVVSVAAALFGLLLVWHGTLLRWDVLLAGIVLVVLFVPIKRYALPGSLPFDLELYRVVVALVLGGWLASLLVDPRVRLRSTALDVPVLLIVFTALASELANPGRVQDLGSYVVKSLTFLASFALVFFMVSSLLTTRQKVDTLLKTLVVGAALVAVAALVERQTAYNVFDRLSTVFPFLEFQGTAFVGERSGRLRVVASAQHPIALGAFFATAVPIAAYLIRAHSRKWWIAAVAIGLGALGSSSRTAIVMLIAALIVFLLLKPVETKRLWVLVLPALIVAKVAVPGSLVTLKESFFPEGGLIAEQSQLPENADPYLAGGRVRLLGPSLKEASEQPLLGLGYGTRVTGFRTEFRNAPILDNQWLGLLLEVGALGFAAWAWLVVRATRRLYRAANEDDERDSWLYAGLCASILSFAIGMFTYDAIGFVQAIFVFWLLAAVAAAALRIRESSRKPLVT